MQLAPTTPSARPLGSNEKAFWKLSESSPLNFAVLAHVRPGLDAERVRAALRGLQRRHPLLRARVELRRGRPWFTWPLDVGDIVLDEQSVARDGWQPVVEDELRRIIPWDRAPLARALLLNHGDGGASFALFFHHAIADGTAAVAAVRDVLWEATVGAPCSPEVHRTSIAAEGALPPSARGLRGLWRRVRIVGALLGESRRLGATLPCPVQTPAAPHERAFHLEQRSFDAATTTALSARTRAHDTTVHGAIGAAMLFAMARAAGLDGERAVSLGSPIDVRDRLSPGVGEQIGMYLSVSTYRGTISPSTRFWSLARAIRERIRDDLDSGRAIDVLPLMEQFYRSLGGNRASAIEFGRRWARSNGTTGLTNLGRVDVEAPAGLEIERLQHLGFPSGLDAFNGFASAYRGSLQLTFNWSEPCFERARAIALVDDIAATLRAAIDGDPVIGVTARA